MATQAEIERNIDRDVANYKAGKTTWGEFMLMLFDDATRGMEHADPDDEVICFSPDGATIHRVKDHI